MLWAYPVQRLSKNGQDGGVKKFWPTKIEISNCFYILSYPPRLQPLSWLLLYYFSPKIGMLNLLAVLLEYFYQ